MNKARFGGLPLERVSEVVDLVPEEHGLCPGGLGEIFLG
jgi:hypothetical protein